MRKERSAESLAAKTQFSRTSETLLRDGKAPMSAGIILALSALSCAALAIIYLAASGVVHFPPPARSTFRFLFRRWEWSAALGLACGIGASVYMNWVLRNQSALYSSWIGSYRHATRFERATIGGPYAWPFLTSMIVVVVGTIAAELALGTALIAWWAGMLLHGLALRNAVQGERDARRT